MIGEGADAPTFDLPAVDAGEVETISLSEFLGREIVVLAFYPGDFNPACGDGTTDLDELDLFTMQKDVSILGVSTDSVFSHRAFAEEFDLHIPLLADTHAEVTEAYGVGHEYDSGQYLPKRAVVVIDPEGEVQYVWSTADLTELPPVDAIREAIDSIGGADTAQARYRVGHAHYVEGRRAFTSAMGEFREDEWMMAQSDFKRAYEEFDEAAAHFNTAGRFAEDDLHRTCYDRAEEKAELLWQAAEWLQEATNAFASGEGAEGQARRADAETPLEAARRQPEPPDPDEFPLDELPEAPDSPADEGEGLSLLADDEDDGTASLDVDIDEASAEAELATADAPDDESATPDRPAVSDPTADEAEVTSGNGETAAAAEETADGDGEDGDDGADEIDEAELEEITAELEEQTREAEARREEADEEEAADDAVDGQEVAAGGWTDDESADADDPGDVELDLADPTEGEDGPDAPADEDEEDDDDDDGGGSPDDDLGGGSSPVPDSL